MLSDWYFCTCLQLTIRQTADYLDIMEILRSPDSDSMQYAAALEQLTLCEPSLRLRALDAVLAAGARGAFDATALSAATELCEELARWAAPDDDALRTQIADLLADALRGPGPGFATRLGRLLEQGSPHHGSSEGLPRTTSSRLTPYQDLADFVPDTVALTLLKRLAEADQDAAAPFCLPGEWPAVVSRALGHGSGRLALLLAAAAVLRAAPGADDEQIVCDSLIGASRGAADLEPDLLTAAAYGRFAPRTDDDPGFAARIEEEIATGIGHRSLFGGFRESPAREVVRARLGSGQHTPDRIVRTSLWQLVLWELFAVHRPASCLEVAGRWWGPPADQPGSVAVLESPEPTESERSRITEWLACCANTPTGSAGSGRRQSAALALTHQGDPTGMPPHAVCSPWLRRKDDRFAVGAVEPKRRKAVAQYPAAEGIGLLRIAALSTTAVRVLRHGTTGPGPTTAAAAAGVSPGGATAEEAGPRGVTAAGVGPGGATADGAGPGGVTADGAGSARATTDEAGPGRATADGAGPATATADGAGPARATADGADPAPTGSPGPAAAGEAGADSTAEEQPASPHAPAGSPAAGALPGLPTDAAVAFLFHVQDVFSDTGCRFFLNDLRRIARPALPVPSSLAALVWHAHRTVQRAGKGMYAGLPAGTFADFLLDGPGDVGEDAPGHAARGRQWELLFRRPALNGARLWIEESASGVRRPGSSRRTGGGWFDPGTEHARRVLATAAERLPAVDLRPMSTAKPDPSGRSALPFAQLLRRDHPGVQVRVDFDWMADLDAVRAQYEADKARAKSQGREAFPPLSWRRLLAAPPYEAADWWRNEEAVDDLVGEGPHAMAMETLRLTALLRATDPRGPGDQPAWVESWFARMAQINAPDEWARHIRGAAVDLFALPDRGPAAQERMRQILERVTDNVIAFSAGAPRYYQRLFDAMRPPADGAGSQAALPPAQLNRLRVRALDTVRRKRWHDPRGHMPVSGPWELLDRRLADAEIDTEVRNFVAVTARTDLGWDPGDTLGGVFVQSWLRHGLSPAGRRIELNAGERRASRAGEPDPRTVVAQGMRHASGDEQVDLGGYLVATRDDQARITDLTALPPRAREQQLARWRQSSVPHSVYGTVCAVEPTGGWMNWGAGQPLRVHGGGKALRLGEPCVVRVCWRGPDRGWEQERGDEAHGAGRPAPVADELRTAHVRWADGELRVKVDGVPGEGPKAGHSLSSRWEPDLSRTVAPGDRPRTAAAVATLARWDADLGLWAPADRTLTELIADDLPWGGPEHAPRAAVLVYVGPGEPSRPEENGAWRFSTGAGRSYLLWPSDWEADGERLAELLTEPGLLVYAGLVEGAEPRLTVLPDPPSGTEGPWPGLRRGAGHDTRNTDWLNLFADAEEHHWTAVQRRGAWHVDVGVAKRFPFNAGFERWLPVDAAGLEAMSGGRRGFRPDQWDEEGARSCRVTGEALRAQPLPNARVASAERFAQFWDVGRGRRFPVKHIRSARQLRGSIVEAVVEDDFTVLVERDALLFDQAPRSGGLQVEISRVHEPRRNRQPAELRPTDEEMAGVLRWSQPLPEVLQGLVVAVYRGGDHKVTGCGVWLRIDGAVRACDLPVGFFPNPHRKTGETFTARRADGGWEFVPRRLYAAPLYERTTMTERPSAPWQHLGRLLAPGAGQPAQVYGREDEARIAVSHATPGERRPAGVLTKRLDDVRERTERQLVRVIASFGGAELVGAVPVETADQGLVDGVGFAVERRTGGLVQLRRRFSVRAGARATAREVERRARSREQTWRQLLAAGESPLETGELGDFRSGRPRQFLVAGSRLPLLPGDEPFVAGNPYPKTGVRAVVVEADARLYASTRSAPPVPVEALAEAVAQLTPGETASRRRLNPPLYYVGLEEADGEEVRRFEWGHGNTVLLGQDELTLSGGPCGPENGFPLFHGDRLVRADFVADASSGRLRVNFLPDDVEIRTGTLAYREAGKHILHEVTIRPDAANGRVAISHVRLRGDGASLDAHQSLSRPIAARLHPDSVTVVLRHLADRRILAEELRILARLDTDQYRESRGRLRVFRYVVPQFIGAHDSGVAAGEHLFMVAGDITRTDDENETLLEFRLPDSVLQPEDVPPLVVRVSRDRFSVRKYLLAQLFDEGADGRPGDRVGRLRGNVMLVKVDQEKKTGRWVADLTDPPVRDHRTLVSAVSHAGGRVFAVLAGQDGRRVEIMPGVVFDLPPYADRTVARRAGRGTLVRLSLDAGNDRLRLDLVQRPDDTYLAGLPGGRPALLLPKSPLLKQNSSRSPQDPGMFTVAGLPALSVGAEERYGRPLLNAPHPRLAVVRGRGRDAKAGPPAAGDGIRAARVRTRDAEPLARPVAAVGGPPAEPEFPLPWARLSFADGSVAEIRGRCASVWGYHDRRTGHPVRHGRPREYPITGRTLANEPVFFDEDGTGAWTLRYRPEHIAAFGGPVTALTERPRPAGSAGSAWYTVAGPAVASPGAAPHGLWLELSPGRVVEMSGRIVVGPSGIALDDLDWSRFGPGDLVRLEILQRELTEPRRLRLLQWRPGPRAAWSANGADRVWLPARPAGADDEAGVRLGDGAFALTYPLAGFRESYGAEQAYRPGAAALLEPTNRLRPASGPDAPAPEPGDVALLGIGQEDRPALLGLPGRSVELTPDPAGWPGGQWLRRLLAADGAGTLRALGGALPVTVEGIEDATVTVSRRRQPGGGMGRRGLLLCSVLAGTGNALVLRDGGALHSLPVRRVVSGLPEEWAEEAGRFLADGGHMVWCWLSAPAPGGDPAGRSPRGRDSRPAAGRPAAAAQVATRLPLASPYPYEDELDAVPVGVLGPAEAPAGLLLRAEHDQGWLWMPAREASWLSRPTARELREGLVAPRRAVRVRRMHDGSVSVVQVRETLRTRQEFRLGKQLRVEPLMPQSAAGAGTAEEARLQQMTARLMPSGVLLRLQALPSDPQPAESLVTEVAALGAAEAPAAVQVVVHGRRKRLLDLPARITTGAAAGAAERHAQIRDTYLKRLEGGTAGGGVGQAVYLLLGDDCDSQADALHKWLRAHGEAAFHLGGHHEAELTELVAAAVVMESVGRTDPLYARGAVLLAHQTGLRAIRSLHVEPLARAWVAGGPAEPRPSDSRLRALRLPPEMDDIELRAARAYGNGILGQIGDVGHDHPSAPVARAVLASIGELPPGEDLAAGADVLSSLAALGRALHPPVGESVAQDALTEAQRDLLFQCLRHALEVPLPLLPAARRIDRGPRTLAEQVLAAAAEPDGGERM
ncbi:hypothetical protein [Streptomyces sp. NPDC046985]|uniref:hypothetical protein n=1 Tax=Streptomyces sp. NPDC046985 TaxID=3155377 RepID=UPI00340FD0B1